MGLETEQKRGGVLAEAEQELKGLCCELTTLGLPGGIGQGLGLLHKWEQKVSGRTLKISHVTSTYI